ncbi:TlpA family protein disulfide reductase [Marinoscillum sp.]|uniref:TlpA family protein disulfide reductase n=1 Tax=Marinoscillum sp. TaxID=2024838 RepID=UPI003BAC18AC
MEPLSIGDRFPPLKVKLALDDNLKEVHLDGSENKLIILEFISTSCGASRKSVTHLQELQNTFPNDLQVILVTQQEDSLVSLVAKEENWTLPIIWEDSILSKMFPYLSVPHQVWISNQQVLAITYAQYANKENVRRFLAGETIRFHEKAESSIDFTQLIRGNNIDAHYMSAITPPLSHGSGIRGNGDQLLIVNSDIAQLYQLASEMPSVPHESHIVWEMEDSLRQVIQGPKIKSITGVYMEDSLLLAWRQNYTFCYNLIYPKRTSIPRTEIMLRDLNHFFSSYIGIKGSVEKREVRCLALVATDNRARYVAQENSSMISERSESYRITNASFRTLINRIANIHNDLGMPLINDTGYFGNINLEIPGGLDDLNNVNKALEKYGLQFVEKDMELEVVVISEVNDNSL